MLSVVLLQPDAYDARDKAPSLAVARSLAWLVSAVVAGVVKDLILATSPDWGLTDLADQVGCELAEADREVDRLRAALCCCRSDYVLVIAIGFQPDRSIPDELAQHLAKPDQAALLLRMPQTWIERLWPDRGQVVGVCAPTVRCLTASSFHDLTKSHRNAVRLQARAHPIA